MATASEMVLYRYSPENMSEDVLKKLFIGREKLLEGLLREIENASRKETPRFYLIVGPRGIGNIEKAFFKIIDEYTPYYQEIFQFLTGQRRKIFDIVISSGGPVIPKKISEEARMNLNTVTTQLRRLETDGYVISRPRGRYTKYEVRERLFRVWREMRQPLGKKRISILLEFLQFWYTPQERKELFKEKFELLEAGEKRALKDLCYIAETRDIQKYYDLQVEEREIVADIVRKITRSDGLVPEEIKRKER